jgi:hypothetical protein
MFLLIADYLSENTETVPFYLMAPEEDLQVETARLKRDGENRITDIWFNDLHATFGYGDDRLVRDFDLRGTR